MNRRTFLKTVPAATVLASTASIYNQNNAENFVPIVLPEPQREGGKSVMASLWERKTTREISDKKLSPQVLSNLLWAAFGVNRENHPRGGVGRTAPSGMNLQGIDIYVALAEGAYLYEAVPHRLSPVVAKDIRGMTNPNAAAVPVSLIYVAKMNIPFGPPPAVEAEGEPQTVAIFPCYGEVETGFIGQNVYLYCASEGLAAWFYSTNKEGLAEAMNLPSSRKVLYSQSVGYPI
ncbi:nitroreductase family protein [bacterium]|nr:nitroreductase family protein [bacterium]